MATLPPEFVMRCLSLAALPVLLALPIPGFALTAQEIEAARLGHPQKARQSRRGGRPHPG